MFLLALGIASSLLVRPANINIVLLPPLVQMLLLRFAPEDGDTGVWRPAGRWRLALGVGVGTGVAFLTNVLLYATPYPSLARQYSGVPSGPTPGTTSASAGPASGVVSPSGSEAAASAGSPPASATRPDDASTGSPQVSEEPSSIVSDAPWEALLDFAADTAPRAVDAAMNILDLRIVLLSQEFGIVWFMPVAAIGGILLLATLVSEWRSGINRRGTVVAGLLTAAYASVPVGVVLVWQSHASSFGFRYLFSLVPVGLLGVALWASRGVQGGRARHVRVALLVITGLSMFSLVGQAFFGTSSALDVTEQLNSFGRVVPYSAARFGIELLGALIDPSAWANMLARGLPGFVALVALPLDLLAGIGEALGILPRRSAESIVSLAADYSSGLATAAPGVVVTALVTMGFVAPLAAGLLTTERVHRLGALSFGRGLGRAATARWRALASRVRSSTRAHRAVDH
jgi:hypothetical protein